MKPKLASVKYASSLYGTGRADIRTVEKGGGFCLIMNEKERERTSESLVA